MISKDTVFPGLSGFIALKARVVGEVFMPAQPFSSLYDLKVPPFICKINETTSEVLSTLLLTESMVVPPEFVVVTVTPDGNALTCCTAYDVNMLLRSRARRMTDFNNTLLIN